MRLSTLLSAKSSLLHDSSKAEAVIRKRQILESLSVIMVNAEVVKQITLQSYEKYMIYARVSECFFTSDKKMRVLKVAYAWSTSE